MSEDDSLDDLDGRRDYPRVSLVAVALLAIVLATTAVPALSPAGADSPISSAVPIPEQMKGGSGGSGGSEQGGDLVDMDLLLILLGLGIAALTAREVL